MSVRQNVSDGIIIFLVILAVMDMIALLPGYFIVQGMTNNPDISNFLPAMTNLMYWFVYFLLSHLITLPVSMLLTAIFNGLNRGSRTLL